MAYTGWKKDYKRWSTEAIATLGEVDDQLSGLKCNYCGAKGHNGRDCPLLKTVQILGENEAGPLFSDSKKLRKWYKYVDCTRRLQQKAILME